MSVPVINPPTGVELQTVATEVYGPTMLECATNLASPNWQPLGALYGTKNLWLTNQPAFFVRGACSNVTVSATVSWQASTNPAVTGYRLYYGVASHAYAASVDVGNSTSGTISKLIPGTRYYFAVIAYSSSGATSPFSQEVTGVFRARFSLMTTALSASNGIVRMTVGRPIAEAVMMPLAQMIVTRKISANITNQILLQYTTNLLSSNWQDLEMFSGSTILSFTNLPSVFIRGICTNLTTSVTLGWQPSSDPYVVGYKLYYGLASHDYTQVIDAGDSLTATVSNLVVGTTYYFAATAYNASGVESSFSNEASGAFGAQVVSLTIGPP